jgi:predicted transcriptional regulator
MKLKIENEETLIRDTKSNAVLNNDMSALQQYRARRNKDLQLRNDVEDLKQDMSEIKELLKQLVSRD